MSSETCSIESCKRPVEARGWCSKHYQRWYRHGDPEHVLRGGRPPGGECVIDGCDQPARAHGWCSKHYARWYRHGDPERVLVQVPHVRKHGTMNEYNNYGCRCDLCKRAWAEWYAVNAKIRRNQLGPCTIEGCDIGQYAKGLCKPHYERQRTGKPMDVPIVRHPAAWVVE